MKTAHQGYRSFQYLKPGADYREFTLAAEVDRVPSTAYPLPKDEQRRVDAIFARDPIVSMHDHTALFPADMGEVFEYRRQGRDWTGYAGLAASDVDVFFENFMDGTALITSAKGWKWDDIVPDRGDAQRHRLARPPRVLGRGCGEDRGRQRAPRAAGDLGPLT